MSMSNRVVFLIVGLWSNFFANAQELNSRITINSSLVSSKVDKKIFQTLQTSLTNFLNNRKWTSNTFTVNERINCNFLITIKEANDENVYKASLVVQASRPVYNSSYQSALINFQDESFAFKYVEYQPVEFNENRISGSDPLVSNLTATLAYYVYMILGFDYDSFSVRGGDPFFQKAQMIVNNAPENREIDGWRAFDGQRNRYWMNENVTNNRYAIIHDALYNYYRLGLDQMYDKPEEGRAGIVGSMELLFKIYTDNSSTMILPVFFQGKSSELIKIFKKGTIDERTKVREWASKMDISNANNYKQELK